MEPILYGGYFFLALTKFLNEVILTSKFVGQPAKECQD